MFSAASLWVATLLLLPLLFVIVYRMAKFVVWFIASDSSVFFLSIQTQCTFNARTPSQYCRICSLDLPITDNTYHTSSVITDMRGAKAAVSPSRRSPPCTFILLLASTRKARGCLAGACGATTSSYFPKQPRRHSGSTHQHSSTEAVVQHAAAAVQARAFVAATSVCRTHSPQLAGGGPVRILQQYVRTRYMGTPIGKTVSRRQVQFQLFVFSFLGKFRQTSRNHTVPYLVQRGIGAYK